MTDLCLTDLNICLMNFAVPSQSCTASFPQWCSSSLDTQKRIEGSECERERLLGKDG